MRTRTWIGVGLAAGAAAAFYPRFVDLTARRPAGPIGRRLYADPRHHHMSFRLSLDLLGLGPQDHLLEIGCGGGTLLNWALAVVGRAAGVDHSRDMLRLSRERNREAVAARRLALVRADAAALPWRDRTFTAIACTNTFFFLPRPREALAEMYRVLQVGGRVVMATIPPGGSDLWRHALWVPALHRYSDPDLAAMLSQAGFTSASVQTRGPHQLAYAVRR
jgi:SAM-dependent methyltransferase